MIPWIQVYTNLPSHRKTCRFRDALSLKSNYEAVGLLVCFWSWAAVNAVHGDLSGYSARDISDAAGYKKSADKFFNALIDAGFVEKTESGSVIHDWEEHAALLMDSNEQQKKNTRDRVRRYRERRKANAESPCNDSCNVTSNGSNAPTLPNLTLPNLTLPNLTLPNLTVNDSSSSSSAGADEQRETDISDFIYDLFYKYTDRRPTCRDLDMVSSRVIFGGQLSRDAMGLMEYAFEAASDSGLGGNWNYINAVLDRCSLYNIFTADEARAADEERRCCE